MVLEETDPPVLPIPVSPGLRLEFEKASPYGPDDPYIAGLLVRVLGERVRLEQQVVLQKGDDLPGFLRGLHDDFRGWAGQRSWRSLEDELRLTAHHDGHVHLRWDIRHRPYDDASAWTFSLVTRHDAGEDLRRLADDFHGLQA